MGTSRGGGCPRRVSPGAQGGSPVSWVPGTVPSRPAASPMGRFQPFPHAALRGPAAQAQPPLAWCLAAPQNAAPRPPTPWQTATLLAPTMACPPLSHQRWPQPLGPSWGQLLAHPPRREDHPKPESSSASTPVGSGVPDAWGSGESVQQPTACWQREPGRRKVSKYRSPLSGRLCRSAGLHRASAGDGASTQRAHP